MPLSTGSNPPRRPRSFYLALLSLATVLGAISPRPLAAQTISLSTKALSGGSIDELETVDTCTVPVAEAVWMGPCPYPFAASFTGEGEIERGRIHTRFRAEVNGGMGQAYSGLEGVVSAKVSDVARFTMGSIPVHLEGHDVTILTAAGIVNANGANGAASPNPGGTPITGGVRATSTITLRGGGNQLASVSREASSTPGDGGVVLPFDEALLGVVPVSGDHLDLEWILETTFWMALRDDSRGAPFFESDFSHTVSLADLRLYNAEGLDVTDAYVITFDNGTELSGVSGEVPVVVTPEPVTLLLVGTGLAGTMAADRRRRRKGGATDSQAGISRA